MATSPEDLSVSFAIDLESNATEEGAKAAQALTDLRSKILAGTDAIKEMQKAQRLLKGDSAQYGDTIKDLKDKISAQKASLASAAAAFQFMGGEAQLSGGRAAQGVGEALAALSKMTPAVEANSKASKEASEGWRALAQLFAKIPGPIGKAAGEVSRLTNEEVRAKAARVALQAASFGIAAATIYAAEKTMSYGIAQADARRNELLRLEGLTKLRSFLYGMNIPKGDSAGFLQNQIDQVSASVSIGRDKVEDFARELYRAGYRGGNLQQALKGISIAAAGGGEIGAAQFRMMAGQALLLGQNLKAVTRDAEARFGPIVRRQMLSLDVQSQKFHESLAHLFDGMKIEPVLEGLHSVLELFDQQHAIGYALQKVFATLFDPIAGSAKGAGEVVKNFVLGFVLAGEDMILEALKIAIFFKRIFGGVSLFKGLDTATIAAYAGAAAFGVFALAVGYAAISVIALLAPIFAVGAAFFAVGALVFQAYKLWQEIDWKNLGRSIVLGIVNGIKGGAVWVMNTIRTLAGDVWKKFKETLGISSPSRVMLKAAFEIPRGIAAGISLGAPEVARAMQTIEPELQVDRRESNISAKEGDRYIRAFEGAEIHIHGIEEPQEFAEKMRPHFRGMLYDALSGAATERGSGRL